MNRPSLFCSSKPCGALREKRFLYGGWQQHQRLKNFGLFGVPRLGERLQSTGSQEAIFVRVVAMQAVPQSPQHGHEQRRFGAVDGVTHVQEHRHATALAQAQLLLRILRYLE